MIFISWAPFCSRSDGIANRLGGRSFMVYAASWGSHPATILFKYLSQSITTLRLLLKHRPSTVFVMAPPIITCVPVYVYCKLFGATFVIDSHTAAFDHARWKRLLFIHRFFSLRATATIVTNEHLASVVRSWGARAEIVSEVNIAFPEPADVSFERPSMTVINTFTYDEPLDLTLEAIRRVPEVDFYITGNLKDGKRSLPDAIPANAHFTDFLPDPEYVGYLLASEAAICLTTVDHTMQRGAYEAAFLGVPIITSNFEVLRRSFHKGAVYVDINVEDIVRGIRELHGNFDRYRREVQELQQEKKAKWIHTRETLAAMIAAS